MTTIFKNKIHAALANPTLQAALDGNAERRMKARLQARAEMSNEEFQAIRQRAHKVRADIVTNLDGYLEKFIAKAQANGFDVHIAADGPQAVQIVRKLAREHQSGVIAKSKTMVGEEIHLNHALESDGLKVVETDLGEYIIQLREELPSHIITPAVHLTRQDVGRTFEEKLGIPYTDDIPTLTAVARRVLRQTFLEADIGISGVNFGVVESGTLCVVTNEGNGRMCTTLPKVHIALMGMERLVPTLDDLALMLGLLPSSATGQKLSVYTSFINGPRGEGELDGAEERHLILIDNDRLALRNTPLEEGLYCIRCGACLNACPIFREIGGHSYVGIQGQNTPYPGPIGSVISPGLFGVAEFGQLARASSLCGACKEACPIDIDLPKMLLRVRAGEGKKVDKISSGSQIPLGMRMGLRMFTWVASSSSRFSAAQRLAGIFSRLLAPFSNWLKLPAFTGWGYWRDFPRPAITPFHVSFSQNNLKLSVQDYSNSTNDQTSTQGLYQTLTPSAAGKGENSDAFPNEEHSMVEEIYKSLIGKFKNELTGLGGTVVECKQKELAQIVLDLLKKENIRAIQAWDEIHLPNGLIQSLREGDIQIQQKPDPSIRAGLTGALAGIALTGSVVLTSGEGKPLTASLLPEFHLVILHKENIHKELAEILSLSQIRQATSSVIITGPSRTADIEMALTIGVHGPREVHVFVI